jgi:hypothetical protein
LCRSPSPWWVKCLFQRSRGSDCCTVHCCTLSWVSAKVLLEWSTNRGGFTHHGRQDPSSDFARCIPTGCSSTVLSAGVLYTVPPILPYFILLHRAHSAHGIPTVPVSLFDGSISLPLYLLLVLLAGTLHHRYYHTAPSSTVSTPPMVFLLRYGTGTSDSASASYSCFFHCPSEFSFLTKLTVCSF